MRKINVYSSENNNLEGIYPKFWFKENGKEYLFKTTLDGFSDIGEVFSTFLYNKLNIKNFIRYEFAKTLDGVEGSICEKYAPSNQIKTLTLWDIFGENYILDNKDKYNEEDIQEIIQHDENFVDIVDGDYYNGIYGQYENSVDRIRHNLSEYCTRHNLFFDKNQIDDSLINLAILDFFVANNDRHTKNILFEIIKNKDGKHQLQLMPILDNGAIFGLHRTKDFILDNKNLNIYPRVGISESGTTNECLEDHKIFGNTKLLLFDAFEYAKTHKDTEKLLKQLTTLNLPALLEEFEIKEDIEIPKEVKNYMQKSYQSRLDIFEDYKKSKNKLDKKLSKYIEK